MNQSRQPGIRGAAGKQMMIKWEMDRSYHEYRLFEKMCGEAADRKTDV